MTSLWQTEPGLSLEEPLFLGILNATPDSFSDGGRFLDPDRALDQARNLLDQGARALDLGAESTRPGSAPVTPAEEWGRLEPVLAALRTSLPGVPLSLDTRHAEVAARGLEAGVAAINDVTGFRDPALLALVREKRCGLIAMRSRMEDGALLMPPYGNPGADSADAAITELRAVKERLLQAGVGPGRILLDPGFGFGTVFTEDRALWAALPGLPAALDWPVERFCIGVSRKRFLAWRAGIPALAPAERDPQGARAHREALRLGYRAIRTHAVTLPRLRAAEPRDAATIAQVQVASWQATYQNILPESLLASLSVEQRTAAFRQVMDGTGQGLRIWVVEARGRIMGFAVAGPCRDPEADATATGEIHAIYLLREAWGQGLGQALMAEALEGLRRTGFREATLWVLERNARARRFYESTGWRIHGAPRTEWQDGIALREIRYRLALDSRAPEL